MFCRTCGKEIIDEAVICPYCGCLTGVPQQPPKGTLYVEQKGNPNVTSYDQNGNPITFDQNGNPITYDRYGNPNNPYLDRYGPHNTSFTNQNQSNVPDEVNAGLVVLSVFFPIVGIVLGITNQNCGKQKSAKAYITAAVISWVGWFFLMFMFGIFAAVFG